MNLIFMLMMQLPAFIVLAACWAVFNGKWTYAQGMVWGVHLPKEAMQNEEVIALCEKSRKNWRRFQWINLGLCLALCLAAFGGIMPYIILWLLWLIEYIVGVECFTIMSHREMYRIKCKHNWVQESTRHMVRIDTGVTASGGRLGFAWQWQLVPLAVVALMLYPVWASRAVFGSSIVWVLYGCSVFAALLFLALHCWVMHRGNTVYSADTALNLAANQAGKRAWSGAMLWAGGCNALAILWVALRFLAASRLTAWDWIFYIILETLAGFGVCLGLFAVQKRRGALLDADPRPLYVDDDEYWKNGWYANPHDAHLMVEHRLQSGNYTFNMAHPAARWITAGLLVFVVGCLIWTAAVLLPFADVEVVFSQTGNQTTLSAASYEVSFTPDEIEKVELLDAMPAEGFVRTNGGSTEEYRVGSFQGSQSGRCKLFLDGDATPILKITLDDLTIYANGDANAWYKAVTALQSR